MRNPLILLTAALLAAAAGAQERGEVLCSDDFENFATSLENWRPVAGGSRVADGRAALGAWDARFAIPVHFVAEADFTFLSAKDPQGNSRVGFLCDGKSFTVSPRGHVFPMNNLPAVPVDGFAIGKPFRLGLLRRCDAFSAEYVLLVNGREVARQVHNLPVELGVALAAKRGGAEPGAIDLGALGAGPPVDLETLGAKLKPLQLTSYGADAVADNFALFGLKGAAASRNRVLNASFEHLDADGYPYYVFRGNLNMFNLTSGILPYERQIENWGTDDKEKHSGNHSVRMTFQEGMNHQCLWIWGRGLTVVKDEPAVLSVFLKADQKDFPVTLSLGNAKKEVLVGTEWERVAVVNPKMPFASASIPMAISFKNREGTVWADDLQIEVGEEPTPFQVSLLDKQKFSESVTIGRPPDIVVPLLPRGVRPDVDLDTWTGRAAACGRFLLEMAPAKAKSEAFLACDEENLYVGIRAFVDDPNAISASSYPDDSFNVFGGESIEFFLDPLQDGKFYQFGVNAANAAADIGRNRIVTWNGGWTHQVATNAARKSLDYFLAMPFADFASDALTPEWLVNVARNSAVHGGGQLGNWFIHSYQKPEGWPKLILPAQIAGRYRLAAVAAAATDTPTGKRIVLSISNQSGAERRCVAGLADPATGHTLATAPQVLKPGASEVALTAADAPARLVLRLTEDGRPVLRQDVVPQKRAIASLVSRLSFYMREEQAVFRAETLLPEPETLAAVLTCGGREVRAPAAARFEIALPLKEIADGTHKASLTLLKEGKEVARADADLVKRPPREHATRINRFSRALVVDGNPHFPFSPLFVWQEHPGMPRLRDPGYAAEFIDFWQKHGFRTLDILSEGYQGSLDRTAISVFLKAANEKGMKVMLWTKFRSHKPEDWGKLIPIYDQPCVISHRVEDEADLAVPSDELRDFIDAMRPLMPYVPTYMSYTPLGVPSRAADLTPDILMCDPYLTNTGEFKPVEGVLADVDAMLGPALEMRKPVFVFLIANNIPTHWREITGAEQIAQTYGSICAGAAGLSYFINAPSTPPHWKALLQLNREIQALNDVLCSEEDAAQAVPSNVTLRAITKRHDGCLYLIACNTDHRAVGEVTFALPAETGIADRAEVLFEDRAITLDGGRFADTFPAHTRHVYKIKQTRLLQNPF